MEIAKTVVMRRIVKGTVIVIRFDVIVAEGTKNSDSGVSQSGRREAVHVPES